LNDLKLTSLYVPSQCARLLLHLATLNHLLSGSKNTTYHALTVKAKSGLLFGKQRRDFQVWAALLNPKTSLSIQKRHPYTGNTDSELPGDSTNVFRHGGGVFGVSVFAVPR